MKKNIDILLAHLQKEHNYLETEMNLCIAEWDFLGAEAFRKPLRHVKSKLEVAKSLKNPQHKAIRRLETMITMHRRLLDSLGTNDKYFNKKLDNFLEKDLKKKIRELKKEIRRLKSIKPTATYNEEKTLQKFLEQLANSEISLIEFELLEEKVALQVRREGTSLILDLIPIKDLDIPDFILDVNLVSLKKLGFNETTFTLEIYNYRSEEIKKTKEILSILIFDVFELAGNKSLQLKIK